MISLKNGKGLYIYFCKEKALYEAIVINLRAENTISFWKKQLLVF